MNTVELLDSAYEPAANSSPDWARRRACASARTAAARGLLIQLVAREIQLAERSDAWLRAIAGQLATAAEPGSERRAAACEQLADATQDLRAELVVLLHRLVARRNRLNPQRRVDVIAILSQPLSPTMIELIDLHERNVALAEPLVELASLRAIEQLLAAMVPLSVELTGAEDSDLDEALRQFASRSTRAAALGELIANLTAAKPEREALARAAEDRAIACFTELLVECGEVGRELDSWRHGFVRI